MGDKSIAMFYIVVFGVIVLLTVWGINTFAQNEVNIKKEKDIKKLKKEITQLSGEWNKLKADKTILVSKFETDSKSIKQRASELRKHKKLTFGQLEELANIKTEITKLESKIKDF